MSKILIWRQLAKDSETDIFSRTDYSTIDEKLKKLYPKGGFNWGNKVWLQAIYSEVSTGENQITFRSSETIEEINAEYDLIIYPMANFFSRRFAYDTSALVENFRQIKIPVYIIACGIQTESYDGLEDLIGAIGDQSSRFIEAIFHTGGNFALRGYYTKEFFDRLGFPDAVVTGCPSVYQLGRDFAVSAPKKERNSILPVFNGNLKCYEELMRKLPESVYLSQDIFEAELYRKDYQIDGLKKLLLFTYYHGNYAAELLSQGRIKMIIDTNDWFYYLKDSGFDFALGNKIHGTIMAILSGVPACIIPIDSRTREMAEFFSIPYKILPEKTVSPDEFYQIYEEADYSEFNRKYKQNYDLFEQFLIKNKIVTKMNENNPFFENYGSRGFDEYHPNRKKFSHYANVISGNRLLFSAGQQLLKLKNR